MIYNILAGVSFGFFFVEILRLPKPSSKLYRKPFNCVPCLSAWTALTLFFLPEQLTNITLVLFGSGCLGALFTQLMYKIARS